MTIKEDLAIQNLITAFSFQKLGISKLWMTSYGNSIASGYSRLFPTKPLLLRNETLEKSMSSYGIELKRFQFARGQNNNEEQTLHWLLDNVSQLELRKMNRKDYGGGTISMPGAKLLETELDSYFPLDSKLTFGLQDIFLTASENLANIVIYHGATGSLIDNFIRNGIHRNFRGITRDVHGLEDILKIIQNFNRERETDVQVYLCGIPDFLGIHISEIVNVRLKSLSKKFANVVYVEPVKQKFFYWKDGKLGTDFHYSPEEYEALNLRIMEALKEQFLQCQIKIRIDRMLYQKSKADELYDSTLNFDATLESYFKMCYAELGKEKISFELFQQAFLDYVLECYPYDFYIPKKALIKALRMKR